jgi:hypothetical protein
MLEQALTALAAAGGTAVVQAAGTDAWGGLRQAVARWFGGGDPQRERAELERLDQTAGALATAATAETAEAAEAAEAAGAAGAVEGERVRIRQEAAWRARIEAFLEGLDDTERSQAAEELRALLARHTPQAGVSAGHGELASELVVGGSADIRAEGGSIAAGVIHGGAHIARPPAPDPSQG